MLFHCDNKHLQKRIDTLQRNHDFGAHVIARYNMHVMITHITGTNNCIADAISRFQMDRFRSLAPQANPNPDPILASCISIWYQSFLQFLQQVSDSASTSLQFNITIFLCRYFWTCLLQDFKSIPCSYSTSTPRA